MPHQPNLFSSIPPSGSAVQTPQGAPRPPARVPTWLQRLELFLYVIIRIYIGVIVIVLPWRPLWSNNHYLIYMPRLASFLMYGAVRGIISGIGILNLWIALEEAIHYREYRGSGS